MANASDRIPVLIVDDDPSVGAWLQLLVKRMGESLSCDATWVTTGKDALAELGKNGYDLILLDYLLDDTDGLELLNRIQLMPVEIQPAVIMLTGGGNEAVAVEAMKRGARDYLVKGALDQATMRRSMFGALEHRRMSRDLARYTEELRQKNEQMEAELAMARQVQQALLPQQYPVIPKGAPDAATLRFAHLWIPSSAMAGDFFEVLEITDDSAGIFLCDVMGHGVRAALVTALIRGLVEEMMPFAGEPGAFLYGMGGHMKSILQRVDSVLFATSLYVVADVRKMELRMANAAHPLPLLIRRSEGTAEYWSGAEPDPALGLFPDIEYSSQSTKVQSGDSLILFTDGVYEAENAAGEAYGLERLRGVVQAHIGKPASVIFEAIMVDLRAFLNVSEKAVMADDICLISVEFP
jgi:phosphoserine phosphatase RsbU/P